MTDARRPREPFAPWDRRTLPGLFDVEETARRIGHYKWIETKLFEALGGWVATVPELDVKLRLGSDQALVRFLAELVDRVVIPPGLHLVVLIGVFCLQVFHPLHEVVEGGAVEAASLERRDSLGKVPAMVSGPLVPAVVFLCTGALERVHRNLEVVDLSAVTDEVIGVGIEPSVVMVEPLL